MRRTGLSIDFGALIAIGVDRSAMKTATCRRSVSVLVAAVVVALIAAAGCCLFDTVGHDHNAMSLDLCTAIAFVAVVFLSVTLGVVGISAERPTWVATPVAVSIPDPPPWR